MKQSRPNLKNYPDRTEIKYQNPKQNTHSRHRFQPRTFQTCGTSHSASAVSWQNIHGRYYILRQGGQTYAEENRVTAAVADTRTQRSSKIRCVSPTKLSSNQPQIISVNVATFQTDPLAEKYSYQRHSIILVHCLALNATLFPRVSRRYSASSLVH